MNLKDDFQREPWKKIKLLVLFGFSFAVVSCSVPGLDKQSGYIKFDIKFPDEGKFSIKAIPAATTDISIKISGEGIPPAKPITKTISRSEANDKVTIELLPVGPKKV